jgi:hypothetical protein
MPDLASNVLSRTSRFSRDYASLLGMMLQMLKSDRSAKFCSFNGRTATKTRLALNVSPLCTKNCRNQHAQWLQDRKFCKTTQRMILMEKPRLRPHMVDHVLPRVSTQRWSQQARHIVRSLSHQRLQAASRPSSPRADTKTRATRLSAFPRRRTT